MQAETQLKELLLTQLHLNESELRPELSFDDLAVDSLELLELVVAIEDAFDIQLDEAQLAACATLAEAAELIMEKYREQV